jgi:hypothetical protein
VAARSRKIRESVASVLTDAGYAVETLDDWFPFDPARLYGAHERCLYVLESGSDVACLVQAVYELYEARRKASAPRPVIVGICSNEVFEANIPLGFWWIDGHAALQCLVVPDMHEDWLGDLRRLAERIEF